MHEVSGNRRYTGIIRSDTDEIGNQFMGFFRVEVLTNSTDLSSKKNPAHNAGFRSYKETIKAYSQVCFRASLLYFIHMNYHIEELTGIAPFIVIPCNDLNKVGIEHNACFGIKN